MIVFDSNVVRLEPKNKDQHHTMSLVRLTIVGKASDEVRYVREFSSKAAVKDGSSIMDFEEELFGFLSGDQNPPSSRS